MRVYVLSAVGLGIPVQPVHHLIGQATRPVTIDGALNGGSVLYQYLQQVRELWCLPVPRNIGFGKADIAAL